MLAPSPPAPSLFKRMLDAFSGSTAAPPRARPFQEMGVSGTAVYGGYVVVREKSPEWTGRQRYVSIADMAVNASIVAAGVHYFLNLIAHPAWTVEPADESAEAKQAAEFVAECMEDVAQPWSRIVRRMGTYRFYGFGIQEWTAKRRLDGRVGWASIEPRPQHTIERWAVEDDGAVKGVWQRAPQTGQELGIPRSKMIYLVDDVLTDSPEGVGLFRHLAEPWNRLKQYYALEARAFERDLRGTPIGRVPYTQINQAVADGVITAEKAAEMTEAMEKFVKLQVKQSDTAITLDSIPYFSQAADGAKVAGVPQWGLELLTGGAAGMAEVAAAITRTQQEMARVLTCENLMLGEASGNRALSEDKSRNLYLVANACLTDMAAAVTQDAVPALCDLNGIPEQIRPKCKVEDVAFKDADAVAGVLQKMAQAGAVLSPDDPVIADVRQLLGVSAPAPIPPELLGLSPPGDPGADPEADDAAELEDDADDATTEEDDDLEMLASEMELFGKHGDHDQSTHGHGGGGDGGGGKEGNDDPPGFSSAMSGKSHDELMFIAQQAIAILKNPKSGKKKREIAADLGPKAIAELKARATKTEKSADLRTLYVKRRLLNADAVREWARNQGLKSALPAGDMHVTVMFSRAAVDWSSVDRQTHMVTVGAGPRSVHQFPPRSTPNGALVLRFESSELAARNRELQALGASWDFPEYLPHVTLTYSVEDASAMQIAPYQGPLIFGPEEHTVVNDDWALGIAETPLAKRGARHTRREYAALGALLADVDRIRAALLDLGAPVPEDDEEAEDDGMQKGKPRTRSKK